MTIDFERIPLSVMENFKGGEKHMNANMFSDENNKIFKGVLPAGASIGFHRHQDGCEMIYVLEGSGKVILDNGEERVQAGLCHYCPKGEAHSLVNDSEDDLVFLAFVVSQ